MSKIRKSAEGENCTVRLDGCRNDTTTTVLAHLNSVRHGHGTAHKNSDLHGAYCCFHCHQILDNAVKTNLDRDFVKLAHYEAILETQLKLIKKGLITL